VGNPEMQAHLLEFDSVHGRWDAEFAHDADSVTIDGTRLPFIGTRKIEDLPLDGVDVVIDCTGVFKSEAKLAPYFAAGVKKVVVSAPVKDGPTANIVFGVNNDSYDPATHQIVTAASCTTNCLAPVVKVIHENLGIKHGSITTIHDVTNTQTIVDRPAKDLRRARSALTSLIPTTTGSATAITLIYPELKGRLNGHAVRVPLLNASLTDCVFEVERETTAEEVNTLFKAASEGPLKGILGYETRPLVSADYTNDIRSSIVDAPSTMVVNGTQVKIYAWYDNEMGYAHRLVDVALMVGASL
jgi:glyceraldehyde 3-phosphate dehydrogenase